MIQHPARIFLFIMSAFAVVPTAAAPVAHARKPIRKSRFTAEKPAPARLAAKKPAPAPRTAASPYKFVIVFPTAIALDGADAERTLLVSTATPASETVDLSESTVYRSSNPKIV